MPINERQGEALVEATSLLFAARVFYGGDLSLKDLKGVQIVTELREVSFKYAEFSAQANTIIALFAVAGMSGDEVLDPNVAD